MDIDRIPAVELTPDLVERWSRFQEADPALASPFFRPEFTMAVAAERDDIHVAVLTDGGEVGGFLPFQLCPGRIGRPVGLLMSNAQGVVAAGELDWDAVHLARACGLTELVLTHVPAAQRSFAPHQKSVEEAFAIDLSDGWQGYARDIEDGGSRVVRKIRQAERRLEREIGPFELVPYEDDPALLDTLVDWKLDRYDGGSLTMDWAVRVCKRLVAVRTPAFAGMLSALRVEGRVVALHMGIRSRSRLAYWYPAFDPEYGRYSPGHILLTRMAEWAPAAGIHALDLGKGAERYKRRFGNRVTHLAEVRVAPPSITTLARRVARASALGSARALLRRVRGLFR